MLLNLLMSFSLFAEDYRSLLVPAKCPADKVLLSFSEKNHAIQTLNQNGHLRVFPNKEERRQNAEECVRAAKASYRPPEQPNEKPSPKSSSPNKNTVGRDKLRTTVREAIQKCEENILTGLSCELEKKDPAYMKLPTNSKWRFLNSRTQAGIFELEDPSNTKSQLQLKCYSWLGKINIKFKNDFQIEETYSQTLQELEPDLALKIQSKLATMGVDFGCPSEVAPKSQDSPAQPQGKF